MRTKGIPTASGEPISLFRTDQALKRHPAYTLAKGGDAEAAARLIDELVARSGKVIPSAKTLELLERRFGDEILTTFGIEPAALTREEAQYLVGFRTVDELRNRAPAAKQARIERLRSKGIRLEEVSAEPD